MRNRFLEVWRALPVRARRLIAGLLGGTVVGIGVLMLVTPGPAILVIPLGLSILAAEFAWVRSRIRRWIPEPWQPRFVRNPGPEEGAPDRPGSAP
ncbi:MAG: PGPGW domain-containing protein [Myxococcota bacterium]